MKKNHHALPLGLEESSFLGSVVPDDPLFHAFFFSITGAWKTFFS